MPSRSTPATGHFNGQSAAAPHQRPSSPLFGEKREETRAAKSMIVPPFQLSILLDPLAPSSDGAIPIQPTHIASWSIPCEAGPSRRIALASSDNSIWVQTSPLHPLPPPEAIPPAPKQPLPSIITSPPSTSNSRPSTTRNISHRSRATSSTSSLFTSSSRFRATALSPPSSTSTLPTTSLTSATATPAASDAHVHGHSRSSLSERAELLGRLGEQVKEEEDESTLSKITGLAKRGLSGVHGKQEHEPTAAGSTSPRSTISFESSRTFTDMFGWRKGDEEEKRTRELKEKMEEVEVEREMQRETREERREAGEARVLEHAQRTPRGLQRRKTVYGSSGTEVDVRRVVLDQSDMGRVVCVKVFEGFGLCILRDVGLLDIYDRETLHRLASLELERPGDVASSSVHALRLDPFWSWKGIHLVERDQKRYIAVDAIPWPCGMPSPNGEVTRVSLISTHRPFKKLSDFDLPGVGHVGFVKDNQTDYLLHFSSDSLTSYPLKHQSPPQSPIPPIARHASPLPRAVTAAFSSQNISLLRPSTPGPSAEPSSLSAKGDQPIRKNTSFTSLRPEAAERLPKVDVDRSLGRLLGGKRLRSGSKSHTEAGTEAEATLQLGEGREVERDGYGEWARLILKSDGEGVGLVDTAVDLFHCDGKRLQVKGCITLPERLRALDVCFTAHWAGIAMHTPNECLVYRRSVSTSNDSKSIKFDLLPSVKDVKVLGVDLQDDIIFSTNEEVLALDLEDAAKGAEALLSLKSSATRSTISKFVPLDAHDAMVIDLNGNAYLQTLDDVLQGRQAYPSQVTDADRLNSNVTVAQVVRSSPPYFVAGDEDGVIRVWTLKPFELQGSWTCFADSVQTITHLEPSSVLPSCLFCTSQDGSIAIIDLESMDQMHSVPASRAPLRRAFIDDHDLLLAYANGKARVWNLRTCEFRRSTGLDAADEMLQRGNWIEIPLRFTPEDGVLTASMALSTVDSDLGRMVNFDLRALDRFIQTGTARSPLATIRNILSMVLTWGVDSTIDAVCRDKLGISVPLKPVMCSRERDQALFTSSSGGKSLWKKSASQTGLRQLVIVTLLRTFLDSPDHEKAAAEIIHFYTTQILDRAVQPDLEFFTQYYVDPAIDIQQSSRMLFAARLARMDESQIETVVETHRSALPSALPSDLRESERAVQALNLIGGIALHRYQAIDPTVLKSTAESLNFYISDPTCANLGLAIELISKGFTIWQTYLDPMELLRLLFYLSTHTPPSATISAHARIAVLHVASTNPALFMSTLSMDILDAKTTEGRTSIMKLCVFMARKNPGVLENGLPRIAEAVVKSLDPSVKKMRDDVWEAATVILNELVLAFTTIDFHSGTQKLAVGTHEGAVIMYDLKSASRLYVLEPHRNPVSSVNFSPDGRRLLTVSLEDGDVTVWKVGSSLSGFFNVGGPPRQGVGKGDPFKRIQFKRADDGPLEEISALSDIRVEWPGTRQARVMIRETALTFET